MNLFYRFFFLVIAVYNLIAFACDRKEKRKVGVELCQEKILLSRCR